MGISFWRGQRRTSAALPWRGVAVTTGVAAVGAVMLTGATASTPAGTATAAYQSTITDDGGRTLAEAVPARTAPLRGFAPPAERAAAADPQFRIAANLPSGPLGIPGVVLQAYKLAANRVAAESPQCKLPWYLLAGIGRIESGHAGGGNVDDYGNTRTKIRGPVLDGSLAGNAVITDTDGGKYDGDSSHDRAMGPMQFIPSTWASWGSDANGDGKADPDNIFDATYAAGRYLCAGVTDIMAEGTRVSAVLRYNRSVAYANNVLGWAVAYATGVVPTGGIPEMSAGDDAEKPDKKKADDKKKKDDKKKDDKSSTAPDSSAPKSSKPKKTTPEQQCLGALCIPADIIPGQPQQKPAPKKQAPNTKKASPTTTAKRTTAQR
ncbi:lytic transglycosylase domain-containing protein [Gordonia sp. VNK21]|uniref:lytic transglycosylase domain-containing protein n=1 Tax=Gordonia sp. VNK21 TaxID=3382483 RepID=UPI0038D3A071